MELLEKYDWYSSFVRAHKTEIQEELRLAYGSKYGRDAASIMDNCDFGGSIGFPMFIIWFLASICLYSDRARIVLAIVMIILGFYLRYYIKHIIDLSCRRCFEQREYREILFEYSERHREEALMGARNSSDIDTINELYDYCSEQIVWEQFNYHK